MIFSIAKIIHLGILRIIIININNNAYNTISYLRDSEGLILVDSEKESLINNICKSIETKGWADIESEYYNLLFKCGESYPAPIKVADLNKHMGFLQDKLVDYLTDVENNNNIVRNDKIYKKIYAPVNDDDLSVRSPSPLEKKIENIMLLDFNYTNTADLYVDANRNCEHIHIHDELKNPGSVIFGYGVSDTDYSELLKRNDNNFFVHIKRTKYQEKGNYRKVLHFIESAPFQVCIMGHSCGNSDRTLLNTIFEHKNCISIKPYYYKKKDGSDKDNYDELYTNISRNFSDPQLIGDRVVNKYYCEPLS